VNPGLILDTQVAKEVMGIDDIMVEPKPYSTDLKCAWEVVDKLRGSKMSFSLTSTDTSKWLAKVEFWGIDRVEFAVAETVPHAICLVALKAVGAHQE